LNFLGGLEINWTFKDSEPPDSEISVEIIEKADNAEEFNFDNKVQFLKLHFFTHYFREKLVEITKIDMQGQYFALKHVEENN
jgi:hypothetical protein